MARQGKHRDFPDKETLNKYLSGELSPEEAHQFEKMVLDNKFYQDAMEGIDAFGSDQVKADLKGLSQRIKSRSRTRKRKNIVVYRIAAAVILLAILSYTLILTTDKLNKVSNKQTVSQKLEEPEDTSDPSTESARISDDATEDIEPPVPEDRLDKDIDLKAASPEEESPVEELGLDMDKDNPPEETIVGEPEIQPESAPQPITRDEEVETERQFELIEVEADAVSQIEISENNIEEPVLEAQEDQAVKSEIPQGLSLQDSERAGKSTEEAVPVLRNGIESAKTRNGPSKQKDSRRAGYVPEIAARQEYKGDLSPEPIAGFEAYEYYISDNLKYPADAEEAGVEGVVELQFMVNKDSIPVNILVIKSLTESCDKEAARLLENGPKWIPAVSEGLFIEKEVRYSIKFELEK